VSSYPRWYFVRGYLCQRGPKLGFVVYLVAHKPIRSAVGCIEHVLFPYLEVMAVDDTIADLGKSLCSLSITCHHNEQKDEHSPKGWRSKRIRKPPLRYLSCKAVQLPDEFVEEKVLHPELLWDFEQVASEVKVNIKQSSIGHGTMSTEVR